MDGMGYQPNFNAHLHLFYQGKSLNITIEKSINQESQVPYF